MIDRPDTSPFFPEDNDVIVTLVSWDTLPLEDKRLVSLCGIDGSFLTPGVLSGLHGSRSTNHVIGHIKVALARQGVLQHFSIKASEIIVPVPRDCSFTQMLDRDEVLEGPLINLKRLKAKAVKKIMRLCTSPPATSAGFLPALRKDPAPFFQRFFEDPAYQGVQVVYWDCLGSYFGAGIN
ncbi:MAG: hypothetical protein IKT16_01550, partial [Desulfovibrio sp.]|nr:hypothetical protein [Desulfovibrio sp.]